MAERTKGNTKYLKKEEGKPLLTLLLEGLEPTTFAFPGRGSYKQLALHI